MPSDEARAAAEAAYVDAISKSGEVDGVEAERAQPAKTEGGAKGAPSRGQDGRFVGGEKPAGKGAAKGAGEPQGDGKAAAADVASTDSAEPDREVDAELEADKAQAKVESPDEQQAKLTKGFRDLRDRQNKIQAREIRIQARAAEVAKARAEIDSMRAQIESTRAEIERARAAAETEVVERFRRDPSGAVEEIAKRAGIDFRKAYEDHFTPRMLNGGRRSAEEETIALRDELDRQRREWSEEIKRRDEDAKRSAQAEAEARAKAQAEADGARVAAAKAAFTEWTQRNEDKYPFAVGMLEPSEIAESALQLVPILRRELSRNPTDEEIAARLDSAMKARYIRSEKLKKIAFGDNGETPAGDHGRGNVAGTTANPEGRKTRPGTVTQSIAARTPASSRQMTREERRAEAMRIPFQSQ